MPRPFDCPRTSEPCTNAECTVMHCETQSAARNQPRPFRLSLSDSAAGWLLHDGGAVPPGIRGAVEIRRRNGELVRGTRDDWHWRHRGRDSDSRAYEIMAYRQLVSGTPSCPIPDGWIPHTTDGNCPAPIGSRGDILRRGRITEGPVSNAAVWASEVDWAHYGRQTDIIAYRNMEVVVPELPSGGDWVRCDGSAPDISPDASIDRILRNGEVQTRRNPATTNWTHIGRSSDVMGYRIRPPVAVPAPGEGGWIDSLERACPIPRWVDGDTIVEYRYRRAGQPEATTGSGAAVGLRDDGSWGSGDDVSRIIQYRYKPSSGGWTVWTGGNCPIPEGKRYEFKFRNASGPTIPVDGENPQRLRWSHNRTDGDIVAYRILPDPIPAPTPPDLTPDAEGWIPVYPAGRPPVLPVGTMVNYRMNDLVGPDMHYATDMSWGMITHYRIVTPVAAEAAPVVTPQATAQPTSTTHQDVLPDGRNVGPLLSAEMPVDLAMAVVGALSGAESVAFRAWLEVHRTAYAAVDHDGE